VLDWLMATVGYLLLAIDNDPLFALQGSRALQVKRSKQTNRLRGFNGSVRMNRGRLKARPDWCIRNQAGKLLGYMGCAIDLCSCDARVGLWRLLA
jgi:hypothetical protein